MDFTQLEQRRITLQEACDQQRNQSNRNRLGQFATPFSLARGIVEASLAYLPPDEPVRFLDPAFGTGAFYSALLHCCPPRMIVSAAGFEIDPLYGSPALDLWAATGLRLHISDFTRAKPESSHVNLLICNPPYVRHHHLSVSEKAELGKRSNEIGVKLSGLAGLYCYFLALSHRWLLPNAISAWVIPSEFMDVNYGEAIKHYLLTRVTLLRIHRFDPNEVQFSDALVSTAIVWFRNAAPTGDPKVRMSLGGTLAKPAESCTTSAKELQAQPKWTRFPQTHQHRATQVAPSFRIGDLFTIKRGLATGGNSFFILTQEKVENLGISRKFLKPVLPSPRYLKTDEIEADAEGLPKLEQRLFLIDCSLVEEDLREADPALARYLESGKNTVAQGYLCSSRKPWYSQENRPPAPFLCTYMGRPDANGARTFRFILNHSAATAANVYLLMYPKPAVRNALAQPTTTQRLFALLKRIPMQCITGEGRIYGGGLHKLEPRELANVPADEIAAVLASLPVTGVQMSLVHH